MDALALVAEVSVAMAGFAGVAVVLGRGPGRWSAGDAARIRLLLGAAFGALFTSLVPIGLAWTGVREQLSVQIGAGVLLVIIGVWSFSASRTISALPPEERALFNPRLAQVIRATSFTMMGLLVLAASGVASRAAPGLLFLGLFLLLGYVALGFVRLMFVRPSSE